MDLSKENKLNELVFLKLHGANNPQEFQQLKQILGSDPEAIGLYVEYMMQYSALIQPGKITLKDFPEETSPPILDASLWMALSAYEKAAPGIVTEKPKEEPVEPRLVKLVKIERKVSKYSLYTLALSAAAVLAVALMVLLTPVRPTVAVLTDSINAEWTTTEEIPVKGDDLSQGALTLARGLAEITFDDGAVVVVEAPAVIDLESPKSMFITRGKMSAVVSEYATGFTVNTPSSTIVDLGTEFGVIVANDGSCSLHMFKGKANLITGRKGQKKTSQIVHANEARRVDSVSEKISSIRFNHMAFVQQLPSSYEQAVLESNPYAYWRFEDNLSGMAMNSANESRYSGMFFGNCRLEEVGPDLGDGESNTALILDGQGSYVKFANVVPKGMVNHSITLWVRPDSDEAQNILVGSNAQGPDIDFSLQLRIGVNKQFEFYSLSSYEKGDLKAKFSVQAANTVQIDRWYFLTATIDENNEIRLYVDGEFAASTMMDKKLFDGYPDIYIGSPAGNKRDYPEHKMGAFRGTVDEIAIFNRVLSGEEIQNMYNNTKP